MEEMRRGVGLDFSTLINTPAFKEIRLYLCQFGYEQMLEKLMAKNPNLDLSCLDEEDEPMEGVEAKTKAAEGMKGIEEVAGSEPGA